MVSKDDKDGQIALLREALEKIYNKTKNKNEILKYKSICDEVEHIAQTALLDMMF